MAWNHKSRVVAMAGVLQVASGLFIQPNIATNIIAVSSPVNSHEEVTADDPTATGTVWEAEPIVLGKTATVGATYPLRGPGGVAPPAANSWVPGMVLQTAGWAEIRKAAPSAGVLQAGSSTTALVLANTESAVDDFLIGAPLQMAALGTGFQQTTLIQDYFGATKTAWIPETLGAAPAAGAAYTIPAYLAYVQSTLTQQVPVMSWSVWRDKKRYDYRDWAPSSLAFTIPVGNEQNTAFPDMTFSGKCLIVDVVDDAAPVVPTAMLAIQPAPARNGKFYLDRVKLGHQSYSFTQTTTLGAASNQNQAAGQDGYDIVSGTRAIAIDLNQMARADFDLHGREDSQAIMPVFSTWGLGSGNNFGFMNPNVRLRPFSPADRNGYVSVTGTAATQGYDKAATLTIWW